LGCVEGLPGESGKVLVITRCSRVDWKMIKHHIAQSECKEENRCTAKDNRI
jgi:hypothetical protein